MFVTAKDVLDERKRKSKHWFKDNYQEFDALFERKQHFLPKNIQDKISKSKKEEAIQAYH